MNKENPKEDQLEELYEILGINEEIRKQKEIRKTRELGIMTGVITSTLGYSGEIFINSSTDLSWKTIDVANKQSIEIWSQQNYHIHSTKFKLIYRAYDTANPLEIDYIINDMMIKQYGSNFEEFVIRELFNKLGEELANQWISSSQGIKKY